MRYILLALLTIFFSGCVTTKIAPKSEYRIDTTIIPIQNDAQKCKKSTLKVSKAFSTNALMSHNMHYVLGENRQYAYSESLWAEDPNTIISTEFLQLLRESQLFQSVQSSKSRSKSDYILEIHIEDFMQYFNNNSSTSFANASITLTLINVKSNEVFATETFKAKVDVEELNAAGGVESLGSALKQILESANVWMAKVCQ